MRRGVVEHRAAITRRGGTSGAISRHSWYMMNGIANTDARDQGHLDVQPECLAGLRVDEPRAARQRAPSGWSRNATRRSVSANPTSAPPATASSARTIRFRKASRRSRIEMSPKRPLSATILHVRFAKGTKAIAQDYPVCADRADRPWRASEMMESLRDGPVQPGEADASRIVVLPVKTGSRRDGGQLTRSSDSLGAMTTSLCAEFTHRCTDLISSRLPSP